MYLRRLRIAKAEELLSTGLKVKDAALRCGFSDEYTFIKCYKQLRSRTPEPTAGTAAAPRSSKRGGGRGKAFPLGRTSLRPTPFSGGCAPGPAPP